MIMGHVDSDLNVLNAAQKELLSQLKLLENHLLYNTYLVDNRITLADISLASTLIVPFKICFDNNYRKQFTNLTRWFTTIAGQNEFRNVCGRIHLCSVQQTPVGLDSKPDNKNKNVAEKKQKQEPKKKEQPKEEEQSEEAEIKMKKDVNPLDELPPTSFDIEWWKRLYSNEKNDKMNVMNEFWDAVDSKGWSFWYIQYDMYKNEGVVLYKTANLLGGFLQRLEHFRKYCFGSWSI